MLCPSHHEAILYTHLLQKDMMVNGQENGLKGQRNLAQGKRSGALGWKADRKIVRAITFIKEKFLFRTGEMTLCFQETVSRNSVRKELFAFFIESSRTVFILHPLPRAVFRFVPPETLPWAELYWPFRPKKYIAICI
jgi:hypothetical protein